MHFKDCKYSPDCKISVSLDCFILHRFLFLFRFRRKVLPKVDDRNALLPCYRGDKQLEPRRPDRPHVSVPDERLDVDLPRQWQLGFDLEMQQKWWVILYLIQNSSLNICFQLI